MTNAYPREIRLTPEFQRKLKELSKRYRQIRRDLEPVIERLTQGESLGDQIPNIGFTVMKARIKSSDTKKGKSGGYRLIYWLELETSIVLLDIYSKSDQANIDINEIRKIVNRFSSEQSHD